MGGGAAAGPLFHDGRAGHGLSDGAARLAARYPRVWHVIEADGAGAWLTETGLLPAADLYRLAGLEADGANRDAFPADRAGPGPDRHPAPAIDGGSASRRHIGWQLRRPSRLPGAGISMHMCSSGRNRDGATVSSVPAHGCGHAAASSSGCGTPARACDRHLNAALAATAQAPFSLASTRVPCFAVAPASGATTRPLCRLANYRSGPVAELAIKAPVMLHGLLVTVE